MASEQDKNEQVATTAGMWTGVLMGARIGTMAIPIPVVGTFVGGLLGGVVGSELGKNVGGAMIQGVKAFTDSINNQGHGPDDTSGGSKVEATTIPDA